MFMTATTFHYFAYGSNMLTARLKARCSGAELVGRAFADGWGIEFSKPGEDGSGKATLGSTKISGVNRHESFESRAG